MVLQECTLLSARLFAGLTMPCLVIMEPTLEITAPSMDTLVTFVKPGWTGKFDRIFEGQIQGFTQCTVNWKEPQAPLVDVSDYGRTTQNEYAEPQKDLTDIN